MNTPTEMNAPVEAHEEWLERQVELKRQSAYADPVTGSDRHFAKAARLDAMGDAAAAELERELGIARYNEIRQSWGKPS